MAVKESEHKEIIDKLDILNTRQIAIESKLDKRDYLDKLVIEHEALMNDNGKPGMKSIRTKVLAWESKITGLALLVAGDIVLRVVQYFLDKG